MIHSSSNERAQMYLRISSNMLTDQLQINYFYKIPPLFLICQNKFQGIVIICLNKSSILLQNSKQNNVFFDTLIASLDISAFSWWQSVDGGRIPPPKYAPGSLNRTLKHNLSAKIKFSQKICPRYTHQRIRILAYNKNSYYNLSVCLKTELIKKIISC